MYCGVSWFSLYLGTKHSILPFWFSLLLGTKNTLCSRRSRSGWLDTSNKQTGSSILISSSRVLGWKMPDDGACLSTPSKVPVNSNRMRSAVVELFTRISDANRNGTAEDAPNNLAVERQGICHSSFLTHFYQLRSEAFDANRRSCLRGA